MLLSESERFDAIMLELTEIFGKKLDEVMRRRYFEVLRDVPVEAFERMAREHMKEGKFFPKPRDLRPREKRQSIDSDERGRSTTKYPEAFTEEWWLLRSKVLRELSPYGVNAAARANLTKALFGHNPTIAQRERNDLCYRQAWPELVCETDEF